MSEIDWVTLTEGEQIVWKSRPSLIPRLGAFVGSGLAIAIGIILLLIHTNIVSIGWSIPEQIPQVPLSGCLIFFGFAGAIMTYLQWWATRFLITTEEVYLKKGIISDTVVNTGIDRVYNTEYTRPVLGRIFSFGTVKIQTAGTSGTDLNFRNVTNPDDVVERIVRQRDE